MKQRIKDKEAKNLLIERQKIYNLSRTEDDESANQLGSIKKARLFDDWDTVSKVHELKKQSKKCVAKHRSVYVP